MNGKDFNEVVSLITKRDDRFDRGAYNFVREALDYTVKQVGLQPDQPSKTKHVSGRDLCEGAKAYALEQYGPMAGKLLETWGVRATADFGEIVYNLVELQVFGTQEEDRREDFIDIYDFKDAFEKPFLPNGQGDGSAELNEDTAPSNE
jgi:uncharacterized repeat protein (TIGR04138 family)|tara:strand:- start:609 stop:1052 length:444 start_codon:yes stop_codon:yes gene_type:complete